MRWTLLVLVVALASCDDPESEPEVEVEVETYDATWQGVQLLFDDHCVRCHDGTNTFGLASEIEAELVEAGTTTGGTTGTAGSQGGLVVPGDPDASRLWQSVSGVSLFPMPMDAGLLDIETIDSIRVWIESGAAL
jgi:hypothetical protein